MKQSSVKTHHLARVVVLIFLVLSFMFLALSSNPWETAHAVRRVETNETTSSLLSINNAGTHSLRVTSKLKNLRFNELIDSSLIEASGKRITDTFDASGLKSKSYNGKDDELTVEMNVIGSMLLAGGGRAKWSTASQPDGNPLLTVNKHHEPNQSQATWQIGVPITYVIRVGNSGTANSHITVADTFPTGFVFVSATYTTSFGATGPSGAIGPSPFGPFFMPNGGQVEIRVVGYFTTSGSKDNTAVASAKDDSGNPLAVSPDPNSPNPTNKATDSVFVPPTGAFPNIAVTKSVTPTSATLSPSATMHYTVTVANTTATDVYLGGIAGLRDVMFGNSIPLNWTVSFPSTWCTPSNGAVCPDSPAPVANNTSTIQFPYNAVGGPAANNAGSLPGNSSYKIEFDVTVSRTVTCGSATAQFFNQAFLDSSNNTFPSVASSQVSTNINTGLTTPCGGGGAIASMSKTQRDVISGAQISNANWNTPVKYRIEISNPTGVSVVIPLTDQIIKFAGTPAFTATVTSSPSCTGCTSLTTPVLTPAVVNADGQWFTLWTATATVPVLSTTQRAVIEYIVVYQPICETDSRADLIVNRIGGSSAASASQVNTNLSEFDGLCNLKVQKNNVTPGPIVFGQPHSYEVIYQNLSASQMDIFVRDVFSIKSNRYGTFSVSSVSSCSVTAGTVTLPAGHPANVVGANATFQPVGWRGIRLINEHLTFGPGSTLKCQVTVTAQQPKDSNPHCQGADNPQIVNSAYMDPNNFNENGASAPNFYSFVETLLPLCRNLIVTKTANANSFGPGQPIDYTITVENIGEDPVSSFELHDTILAPLTLVSGTQVSACTPLPTDCTTPPNVTSGNQIDVAYGILQPNHHPVSFVVHALAPQAGGSYPNVAVGSFLPVGNFYFQGDLAHFLESEENIQVLTPTLTKAFDPVQIGQNGTSTLTFNVTNTNSDPKQSGIAFSDKLPAGLQIVSVIANGCGGNVTTSTDGRTVTLTGGQLVGPNADGSGKHNCQISVSVKAKGDCGVYKNTKDNFSNVLNLDVTNINQQLEVIGCPPPTESCPVKTNEISCKADGTGGYLYTFTVTNNTGLVVTDVLLTPVPGSGITLNPKQPQLPAGGMAIGASLTFQVTITGGQPQQQACFYVTLMTTDGECCTTRVCPVLPDCCGIARDESIECNQDGTYTHTLSIVNTGVNTIEHIYLYPPPGVTMTPNYFQVSLKPGETFTTKVTIKGGKPGDKLCFDISLHTANMESCCKGQHCIVLPDCRVSDRR
ncbi:MAG: hypothetical protein AABN95_21910 [Acidobacteriota bacterium]